MLPPTLALWLCAAALAWEPPAHDALLPDPPESGAEITAGWARVDGWWRSPVRPREGGGSRVGALALLPTGAPLALEARGVSLDGSVGPWVTLDELWRDDEGFRVLAHDLGAHWPLAELRARGAEALESLSWELRVPVNEPRGAPVVEPPSVSAALQGIGVISREEWGASPTTCTTTEDDWYRMAIHHTAGGQTAHGSVQGAVRALQAYSLGAGTYCDIPYQFLVGYDGSLWEGRPLAYYSGATGGGNNDGNIALSFLGCYDPSCSSVGPHAATDAMMAWARLLIHTLAAEHAFAVNADTVRGHRDWPGNATACPGEYVVARFDELLSQVAYYQGTPTGQSFPALHQGDLVLSLGQQEAGWIDVRNDGMETWEPGATFLAPVPRDQACPLAGNDWVSPTRAATVGATTAPGQTGRFSFSLAGNELGTTLQYFGLVQEWVTWFADAPYGGGPSDAYLAVSVQVVPADTPDSDTPTDSEAPGDSDEPDTDPAADAWETPGARAPNLPAGGCACTTTRPLHPRALAALLALMSLTTAVRRRD